MNKVKSAIRVLNNLKNFTIVVARRRGLHKYINSFKVGHAGQGKTIVFNTVHHKNYANLIFESFLAMKVVKEGWRAFVLLDDGILKHYDSSPRYGQDVNTYIKNWIVSKAVRGNGLYRYYSEFVKEADEASVIASDMIKRGHFTIDGVDLWPSIEDSIVKNYLSAAGFIQEEADYDSKLRLFTENAVLSYMVATGVDKSLEPDVMFNYHGIYSAWAPFYNYFKQKGIPSYTYSIKGFKGWGIKYRHRSADSFFSDVKENIDGGEAAEAARRIMGKRFAFQTRDLARYGDYGESEGSLRKIKGLLGEREAFALFTNVLWDSSLAGGNILFENPADWLISTIRHFNKQQDKVLIVRAHPAESSTMPPRFGVRDIVSRVLGVDLSDTEVSTHGNVIFIPSSVKLKSYALFDLIKGGVVYNGTIGLEMMYDGLPVLIAGRAPYLDTRFATRLDSRKDYFQAFDRCGHILERQESNRDDLVKFIYYYFDLMEMPLRHFGSERDITDDPEDILQDETLTKVANHILTGSMA